MGERRKEEGGRREGVRGEEGRGGWREGGGDLCGFMFHGLKLAPTDVILTRLWLQHDLHWLPYYLAER